jgi:long-chain fatty acid transport protein
LVVALAMVFAVSHRALGTGFFINQQSVRSGGRVDAGNTAIADELATIFYNPAGLPRIWDAPQPTKGIRISFNFHLILPGSDLRNRGSVVAAPGTLGAFVPVAGGDGHNPTDATPVPNVYVAAPLGGGRAAVGLGLNVPFGLSTQFSQDWHGRYDSTAASLRTVNVSLVAAYRINERLSVGGGLDLQSARATLSSAIPNPLVPGGPTPSTDASITTTGNTVTPGFNVGVLYDVSHETRLGAHYRSGMKHDISGSSDVVGLSGPLSASNGVIDSHATLKLPAITAVGLRTKVKQLVLLGEFDWFDWSTFNEIRIQFADGRPDAVRPANYRDAHAIAAGTEYLTSRGWIVRGGVHYDTTPTVDGYRDTTVPDANRLWLGVGASVPLSSKAGLDVGYNHAFFRDAGIAVTRGFFNGTPLTTVVNVNSGITSFVNNVAVGVHYVF